ncbi:peptidylprolyl isomerase [Sphingomonas sp. LB-2]|uniref:peptidylprolyl isomerase n=1 Tax=Sphingomonas caeni TaxID=2984949 RepID=UPI00222E3ADF|nr:peptidylprolyl isomerase [Sphingomonas caeni]MCW3848450.1 peptidylprolyl isomerase [Sphingomonas caeni]
MVRTLIALLLSLLAFPAFAQTTPAPKPPVRVAIVTSVGSFTIEMDDRAPISSRNFLRYVDQKRLDGITFYRVVKVQDNFGFVQFGVRGAPRRVLPPIAHEPTTQTGIRHTDMTLSLPRFAPGTAGGDFTIVVGDQPSFDADPSKPGDNLGYAAFAHVVEGREVVIKIFDAPNSPTATDQGYYKGEIPQAPVTIISARRVTAP